MAQFDTSMYGGSLGAISQGLNMRAGIDKRREQKEDREAIMKKKTAIEDAYKANTVIGEDGKTSLNKQGLVGQLAQGGYGEDAFKMQKQFKADDDKAFNTNMAQNMKKIEMTDRLLGSVQDEPSYQRALQEAQQMGLDVSQAPPNFQKDFVDSLGARNMQAKERMAAEIQARGADRADEGMDLSQDKFGYQKEKDARDLAFQREKFGKEFGLKGQALAMKQKEALKKEHGGKELSANMVKKINEGNAIPTMLGDIAKTIETNAGDFGPIEGRIRQNNPYDTRAQTINAQMRASSQAFGRFMEGGVLRKEDEEKYRKMFPNLSDTPDVAQNKLSVVNRLLQQKQNSDVSAFKAQGYDLTGLDKGFDEAKVPAIIAGKPAPQAPAVADMSDDQFDQMNDDQLDQMLKEAGL